MVGFTIRWRATLAGIAALLVLPARQHAQQAPQPPQTESSGPSRIDARVLLVAAHPDDEDTQLITWLVRGRGAETAYLSLTRGDGGQNLIGNELGEALGVIRTQELLAARRIDGARQFFTRAYDFGFSKSAEETFSHWPKEELLGDVVKVVRAFRPHIIVALFQERGGHGQHQVSAVVAREAYDVASDTVRFPAGKFGQPWIPLKFYRTARFSPALATLRINVGEFNPALGASYAEIAAESRSQHKSQGFGMLRRLGVVWDYITLEHARTSTPAVPGVERSIFDGLNIPHRGVSPESTRAEEVRRTVAFQAVADRQTAAPGEAVSVTKTIYNRGKTPVILRTTGVQSDSGSKRILPDSSYQWVESIIVAEITQPWWLSAPRTGDLFTPEIGAASEDARARASWAKAAVLADPLAPPVVLSTPIVFHYVDPVRGDVQRPLVVAPGISVTFDRSIELARSAARLDRFINVTLRSAFGDTTSASVALELPPTLRADSIRRMVRLAPGATRTLTFRVRGTLPRGTHEIRAVAEAKGRQFRSGYMPVEYEHIEPDRIYRPAALTIRSIDVALSPRLDVAYIQGVGDNAAP
ncbi:MAG TPA: PIG-L family deacetylase, partial [Gemmatimonadaceae bacterium]|nr:PIG-L family deacetylase [Gemmatimonadaceae bacterium]